MEREQPTSPSSSAPPPPALDTLVTDLLDGEGSADGSAADGGAPEEWRQRKSELDALLRSLEPDGQP